jgi:hypothetical protein
MRRYGLFAAGLVMVGSGAYLIFGTPNGFPLWFVWLAGSLLWYLGIAVTIGGLAWAFLSSTEQRAEESGLELKCEEDSVILRFRELGRQTSPAGVLHEIPSMGGFIL